ncbi:serine/threonine protein kinase [Bacillus amyloliquefaciens]|uniref:serine/threonine protein kinase n=1 Tax=Bacillus amyloliquefaciens TaxID=1390 RepID=UPI002DB5CFF3|nr:serine/threonine protein kinase [Bacillus amyloliquefaciens]MEC3841585.1 serine/threonine protein kinase [Bacillus amyloliquefaciens]
MSEYQDNFQKLKKKHLTLWKELIEEIFNTVPSQFTAFNEKNQIIEVLNKIGKSDADNHMFKPNGGGDDLSGATSSVENGKIELDFAGDIAIINPVKLTFHPIGENPEWWFFRLETRPFERVCPLEATDEQNDNVFPSSSYDSDTNDCFTGEDVLELEPGNYEDRSIWEDGFLGYDEDGREIRFPKTARIVTRMVNGGSYVIFPKYSLYNQNPETYDGRHNKFSDEEFADYIKKIVDGLEERLKK